MKCHPHHHRCFCLFISLIPIMLYFDLFTFHDSPISSHFSFLDFPLERITIFTEKNKLIYLISHLCLDLFSSTYVIDGT